MGDVPDLVFTKPDLYWQIRMELDPVIFFTQSRDVIVGSKESQKVVKLGGLFETGSVKCSSVVSL